MPTEQSRQEQDRTFADRLTVGGFGALFAIAGAGLLTESSERITEADGLVEAALCTGGVVAGTLIAYAGVKVVSSALSN